MSHEHAEKGTDTQPIPRRKPVPLAMAKGPYEYIPGDQEPSPSKWVHAYACCGNKCQSRSGC